MKKIALVVGLMAAVAYAAPVFTQSWDFEDVTPVAGHPDWSAGVVDTVNPFSGQTYSSNRLYTGDNTAAWASLSAPTNSFIFSAEVRWDAGSINGLRKAGIGYRYAANGNEVWFQGKDTGWPVQMQFGDPYLPNPRPGATTDWADYQWQGGSGRTVYPSSGDYFMAEASTWDLPDIGQAELMLKYNTPDNPGTVEMYFRSLDYDNVRAPAGQWLKLGWPGYNGAWYEDFILGTDPVTGDIWDINQIKLGGANAWSQCSFDNVSVQSIPEPATALFLVMGGLFLARRRR